MAQEYHSSVKTVHLAPDDEAEQARSLMRRNHVNQRISSTHGAPG
jgi:hypothetical protein